MKSGENAGKDGENRTSRPVSMYTKNATVSGSVSRDRSFSGSPEANSRKIRAQPIAAAPTRSALKFMLRPLAVKCRNNARKSKIGEKIS